MPTRIGLAVLSLLLPALAVAAPDVTYVQPDPASGTSAAVVVGGEALAHTAQFLPSGARGKITGKAAAQIQVVLRHLDAALKGAHARLDHAIKINVYAADAEVVTEARRIFARRFSGPARPAVTFVMGALPDANAKVAMDVVAVSEGLDPTGNAVARIVVPSLAGAHAGTHVAVLPAGATLYLSGFAELGATMAEATRRSLEGLAAMLAGQKLTNDHIVQVKAFLHDPVANAAAVKQEVQAFFTGRTPPPLVLVEWRDAKYPIEIELVAAAGPAGNQAGDPVVHLNPKGVEPSVVFSRMARLDHGKAIYLSGIYGQDTTAPAAEIQDIFIRLTDLLKATGSGLDRMVKATYYITNDQTAAELAAARKRIYDSKRPPAASKGLVPGVGIEGKHATLDMIAAKAAAGAGLAGYEVDGRRHIGDKRR